MAGDRSRLYPTWLDHQRHPLVQLRQALQGELESESKRSVDCTVVDVGCGAMPYAPLFQQQGARYVGCDLGGQAEVAIVPGQPVPLADACADYVVSFQVLEHVWDLDWYLGECRRLLRPGGALLLSTHGAWPYHPHPTDFRRWTEDGLRAEMGSRGLQVERCLGLVGPLAWTTQFRLLGFREVLRRVPILGQFLLWPLCLAMNLRMVVEDAITPPSVRQANACIYLVRARRATSES
jgi:SAM-dependent methyltransferase